MYAPSYGGLGSHVDSPGGVFHLMWRFIIKLYAHLTEEHSWHIYQFNSTSIFRQQILGTLVPVYTEIGVTCIEFHRAQQLHSPVTLGCLKLTDSPSMPCRKIWVLARLPEAASRHCCCFDIKWCSMARPRDLKMIAM